MSVTRQVIAAALVLAAAACATQRKEVGKAPENPTTASRHTPPGSEPRGSSLGDVQQRIEAHGPGDSRVEVVDPAEVRIGAATSKTFHRTGCKALEGVSSAEQLRFTSRFEAYDAGYAACGVCNSGD